VDQLVVRGGKSLRGEVEVSGAKNAALPLMAASLLTQEPVRLSNVPRLMDVRTMSRLLRHIGVEVTGDGAPELTLQAQAVSRAEAPYELVKTMRASVVVLGPLVARQGRARVSLPGGCAIGPRPINLHLMGLEKLGATIRLDQGYVEAEASHLTGARITFHPLAQKRRMRGDRCTCTIRCCHEDVLLTALALVTLFVVLLVVAIRTYAKRAAAHRAAHEARLGAMTQAVLAAARKKKAAEAAAASKAGTTPPVEPPGVVSLREERECPFCAERILKKARVCKHCRRDVDPLA